MTPLAQEAYDLLLAKEYDKAYELYTALEKQNDPTSFYYLGFLYFRGFGLSSRTHYRNVVFKRKDTGRILVWLIGIVLLPQLNYFTFN